MSSPHRRAVALLAGCLALAACGSTVPRGVSEPDANLYVPVVTIGSPPSAGQQTTSSETAPSTSALPTAGGATGAGPATVATRGASSSPLTQPSPPGGRPSATASNPTMPASGPGWNEKDVFVGVPTENDASSAIAGLGLSFNPGNAAHDVAAEVKALNAAGGVLGHQIVPVYHDNSTASIESNAAVVANQNCTYFSQDRRVAEVINGLSDLALPPCFAPLHIPDVEVGSVIDGTADYQKYGPYLWTTEFPNVDQLADVEVDQLYAEGYFGKWNPHTSSALGGGPVKVGILEPATATGSELTARLAKDVAAKGIQVAQTFAYTDSALSYSGQMAAAELRFAAAGVTHVINIPPVAAAMLFFIDTAQAQGYHFRYAFTSYDLPNQAVADLPHAQLAGAMGVGFDPGYDAIPAVTPKPNAAATACDRTQRRAGVANSTPLEIGNARDYCDALNLFVQAATAGGGFTADDIAAGMASVGRRFVPGGAFGSKLSASDHSMPAYVRDLFWTPSCTCFAYRGGLHPMG
ncbi:MAG TPA: hypothetical protein VG899_05200 [Mycobacteriales bacterium]|nr:hypothetical protein [Mycobacteriales bacterium]